MTTPRGIEDMTYAQDEALLPCPFCGEIPELEFLEVLVNFRCPPVSSCNGTGLIICCTKDNLERAITAWNRRADLARPSQAGDDALQQLADLGQQADRASETMAWAINDDKDHGLAHCWVYPTKSWALLDAIKEDTVIPVAIRVVEGGDDAA